MTHEEDEEKRELRVHLQEEFHKKIDDFKDFYGIQNNADVIRFIINEQHRKIIRVMKNEDD